MPSIICRMKRNFCTSSLTACSAVPEPFAIRATRDGSRMSAYGSRRSSFVKLEMMASIRTSSRSSRLTSAGIISLMPGILPTMSFSGPIFWIIRICSRKSSRVKLPWSIFIASSVGLLLVDDLLEVLHQADDVAQPEDALGHPLRAELLELVDPLPDADEADGRAGDLADAQRRTAARVAVELGHDDARETEPLVEASRHLHGVLSDHRIDDEQDVLGPDRRLDRRELLHEPLVDREAPRGVVDDDVAFVAFASAIAGVQISSGVAPGMLKTGRSICLPRIWSCSTAAGRCMSAATRSGFLPCAAQVVPELRGRGRLAGPLEPDHHDPRRSGRGEGERLPLGAHEGDELVVTRSSRTGRPPRPSSPRPAPPSRGHGRPRRAPAP